jgi:hypothetical protein
VSPPRPLLKINTKIQFGGFRRGDGWRQLTCALIWPRSPESAALQVLDPRVDGAPVAADQERAPLEPAGRSRHTTSSPSLASRPNLIARCTASASQGRHPDGGGAAADGGGAAADGGGAGADPKRGGHQKRWRLD